jgi:soluble lytic murein transglycosylase-like protein
VGTLLVLGLVLAVLLVTRPAASSVPPGSGRSALDPRTIAQVNQWRLIAEQEASNRYRDVTTPLVLAVIARESSGDDQVLDGAAGEIGLMQISNDAWADYHNQTMDPDVPTFSDVRVNTFNIRVGAWYLAEKIEDMGTVFDGLRAYNRGTTGATRDNLAGAEYARWVLDVAKPVFA